MTSYSFLALKVLYFLDMIDKPSAIILLLSNCTTKSFLTATIVSYDKFIALDESPRLSVHFALCICSAIVASCTWFMI